MELGESWQTARANLDKELKRLKLKDVVLTDLKAHEFTPPFGKTSAYLFTGTVHASAPDASALASRFFAAPGGAGIEAVAGANGLDDLLAHFRPGPGTPFDP